MDTVHFRIARGAAPALLTLALASCGDTGGRPPAPDEAATPAAAGVHTGPVPPLPAGLPAPYLSGTVPTLVPPRPDSAHTPEQSRPWFDVFSWQSFIALNWPASSQGRGNPQAPGDSSVFLNASNGALLTWSSYKESWELFGQREARPTPFDDWGAAHPPCPGLQPGQKAFTMNSKGNSLFNDAAQSFSFPLIDQAGGYSRYEVRYNRAQYDTMRGPDGNSRLWFYLARNLAGVDVSMPASDSSGHVGSIMVKASWRPLTPRDDSTRYYHVRALVLADSTGQCTPTLMGLVGLHIAQKQVGFPQWVWSSFEHVNNVPGTGSRKPYSYNNGLDTPRAVNGWSYRPDTVAVQTGARPVQVTRVNDIPSTPAGASTQDINRIYQSYLGNTVWANYQLVITQWPSMPRQFVLPDSGGVYPRDAGAAFPVWGAVNTSMETYFQTRGDAAAAGGNSCMSCHYQAGKRDFSWGLARRPHQ